MYVHSIEFGVHADQYDQWFVHARNSLGAFSRMEGLVLIRLYRDKLDPTRLFSLRVWRSKEHSELALKSPQMAMISSRAKSGRYGQGLGTKSEQFELWEHVFGRNGPAAYRNSHGFTNYILVESPKSEEQPLWPAYVRNCASVFARQKGLISYEAMRKIDDSGQHLVLRTWESEEASLVGPEWDPNEEVKLVVKPARDWNFYQNVRSSQYRSLELVDAVYGATGEEDYVSFIRGLGPI